MKKIIFYLLIPVILFAIDLKAQPGIKHILLEEFSTAPCGFCPEGDLIAGQLIDIHPEVIWVTHHAGFGTDSMTVPENISIANAFTTFAPGACIDRGDYPIPVYTMPPYIAISRQKWDSVVTAHLNDPAVVDVLISNNYQAATRKLDCTLNVNFINAPAPGDLRLNLFLVEDSVQGFGSGYDQTNYFNTTAGHAFFGMGNPIVGYIHHHVIRKVVTGAWGMTGVIPNNPAAGSQYSYTFNNIDILSNWKEQDMTVVAFVSYYNTDAHLRQVINSNEEELTAVSSGFTSGSNEDDKLLLFPNPANEIMTLQFSGNSHELSSIEIYDMTGQMVVKNMINDCPDCSDLTLQNRFTARINIADLRPGTYMVEVKGNRESRRKIFIKE